MVDHSHLSAGNSLSSPSRDLSAEFGVSKPNSPNCLVSDMAKSEVVPLNVSVESDDSEANSETEARLGLTHGSGLKEIFSATQHFSSQGYVEAADERKKNKTLMYFILAHGFNSQQISEFANGGKPSRFVNAHDLFDKSSLKDGCLGKAFLSSDIGGSSMDPICLGPAGLEEGELARSPVALGWLRPRRLLSLRA